jgi:hypothetical protein
MNSKAKIIAILVVAGIAGPAFGVAAALVFAPAHTDTESVAKVGAPIEHKPEVMIAKITRELIDGTSCSVGVFNNATGRISEAANPCSSISIKNDPSAAAPMGTIHRLEAIQDSFENKDPKPNSESK